MGQDIHAYLQDRDRTIGGRISVGRDYFLFGLMGVGDSTYQHPQRHEGNGLPAFLSPGIAADLLVAASRSHRSPRYHLAHDGTLSIEDDGPLAVHPDYHSASHLDADALERVLGIWGESVDYGHTSARPEGVSEPPLFEDPQQQRALEQTYGVEVEVPWWPEWAKMPGPPIDDPKDLVRLVVRGAMPRRHFEPALERLRSEGVVMIRRYAHLPPQMGGRWQPRGRHPELGPVVVRMRALEAAGGSPLLVVFFDN